VKLSALLRGAVPPLSPATVAEPRALAKQIERVEKTFPSVRPMVREKNPRAVATAFQERVRAWNWEKCTYDDVAAAARAAADEDLRGEAGFGDLRDFLLREAAASSHGGFLKTMVDVHVASYAEKAKHTAALAGTLAKRRGDLPSQSRDLLTALPEALNAVRGGALLGRRMAASARTDDIFASLPVVPSGGLIDTASADFVMALAPGAKDPNVGRRLLDWFAPEGGPAREVGAPLAVDSLLAPWRTDEPPEAWKRTLLERLVAAYDDPRLTPGGAWGASDARARETFIRWQTGATLRAFLDIVSLVEESHMWADRRPFWEGLYDQGHIQAAWVAFSKKAAVKAVEMARRHGDDSLRGFGRQVAGGSRADTSILILRINGRTVVEGSHSYKVHVFPNDHGRIPVLFRSRYDCEEIRLSLAEEHKRTHLGNAWKDFVREKTGCPL